MYRKAALFHLSRKKTDQQLQSPPPPAFLRLQIRGKNKTKQNIAVALQNGDHYTAEKPMLFPSLADE